MNNLVPENRLEEHLAQHGISLREVSGPLDRCVMKMFKLETPIGFSSFWRRALWFSTLFTIGFIVLVAGSLKISASMNLFEVLPPSVLISCLAVLMLFGFVPAYFEQKYLKKKYGHALSDYLGTQ